MTSTCSVCGHLHVVAWLLHPAPTLELCLQCAIVEQELSSVEMIKRAMQTPHHEPEQRRLFELARWQIACARVPVLPERVR